MRIAIDLGGTHLRVACRNGMGEWSQTHRERRAPGFAPDDLVERLRGLCAEWGVRPIVIGVSVAAVVGEHGHLEAAENLKWADVPLGEILGSAFPCPVVVETDVFCGAYYELRQGLARDVESALYLSVGTGVGHAIIADGRIWRGVSGAANAFGHLVLERGGKACYCGHRGCLCTVASGKAQAEAVADGNPTEMLAQGIGVAVTLFEPEAVILSGGALNQPWFDVDALASSTDQFSYPAARRPRIVRSSVENPNLLGVDLLSLEQL